MIDGWGLARFTTLEVIEMVYSLYDLEDDKEYNHCDGCGSILKVVQPGRTSTYETGVEDVPTTLVCINVECRLFKVVVIGEFQ